MKLQFWLLLVFWLTQSIDTHHLLLCVPSPPFRCSPSLFVSPSHQYKIVYDNKSMRLIDGDPEDQTQLASASVRSSKKLLPNSQYLSFQPTVKILMFFFFLLFNKNRPSAIHTLLDILLIFILVVLDWKDGQKSVSKSGPTINLVEMYWLATVVVMCLLLPVCITWIVSLGCRLVPCGIV